MIDQGVATDADTATHKGALVWKTGAAIVHPDDPPGPGRRRVYFEQVPEPKTVKNRVHLDVRVGSEQVEAEVERLKGLGGTFLYRGEQGPHWWMTMADPEAMSSASADGGQPGGRKPRLRWARVCDGTPCRHRSQQAGHLAGSAASSA
jgi:hypothetical protein